MFAGHLDFCFISGLFKSFDLFFSVGLAVLFLKSPRVIWMFWELVLCQSHVLQKFFSTWKAVISNDPFSQVKLWLRSRLWISLEFSLFFRLFTQYEGHDNIF